MDLKDKEARFELAIAALAAAVAIACIASYVLAFHSRSIGDPSSWGTFGDYVGGLLNPVIGLVTALLLVRSLRASRASNSTALEQLNLARQQHEIDLHTRRLDMAIAAWERAMEIVYAGDLGLDLDAEERTGKGTVVVNEPLGSILTKMGNINLVANLKAAGRYKLVRVAWIDAFNYPANIIREIGEYCEQLDLLDSTKKLSLPYRRRVSVAAKLLCVMGQLPEQDQIRVTVPQYLGDIGRYLSPGEAEANMAVQARRLTPECVKAVDDLVGKLAFDTAFSARDQVTEISQIVRSWPHQEAYVTIRLRNFNEPPLDEE